MTAAAPELVTLKQCARCRQEKPLEAFTRDRAKADGRAGYCQECKREHNAEWRKAHPDYFRDRRDQAPHHGWEDSYARRARAYGNPVVIESFTREELVERYGDECLYCGGPFEELDHNIPVAANGPHSLNNCRPSCSSCNTSTTADAKRQKRRRETVLAVVRARQAVAQAEARLAAVLA